MEKYTVDLEIARQLKEDGFPQDTEWFWETVSELKKEYTLEHKSLSEKWGNMDCNYASPIAEEILEKLPFRVEKGNKLYDLNITKDMENFQISYVDENERWKDDEFLIFKQDKKPSNALAKMYIFLKKEKLI